MEKSKKLGALLLAYGLLCGNGILANADLPPIETYQESQTDTESEPASDANDGDWNPDEHGCSSDESFYAVSDDGDIDVLENETDDKAPNAEMAEGGEVVDNSDEISFYLYYDCSQK